jgi:hypothetical protein
MTERYKRPTDDLAPLVGKATIAWNDLQFAILSIFFTVLPCPRELSEALFFSIKSDRAQREMVRAAVEHVVAPIDAMLAKKITDLFVKIEKKQYKRRNSAVHAMWMIRLETQEPAIYQEKDHLSKKGSLKEIKKELEAMTVDFMEIANDLFEHKHALWHLIKFGKKRPS